MSKSVNIVLGNMQCFVAKSILYKTFTAITITTTIVHTFTYIVH